MAGLSRKGSPDYPKGGLRPWTLPPPNTSFGNPAMTTPITSTGGPTVAHPTPSTMVHIVHPPQVNLAPPERFYGDPKKYTIFINQCKLHFLCKPAAFPDDQTKTTFVLSYLGGNAASWSISLIENDHPVLFHFNLFCHEMEKLFDRKTHSLSLDRELLTLRQGSLDLLTYVTTFNRLVVETEWPEEKRSSLFYQGLRGELKDVLAQVVSLPESCEELSDLMIPLDHRLLERRGIDPGETPRFSLCDQVRPFPKTPANVQMELNLCR